MNVYSLIGVLLGDPLIATFAVVMSVLFLIDLGTFFTRRGRHLDCKGIITTLGLLGTFLGIFQGLAEFRTEAIGASIPRLLEGLKFAFLTSILGMILAVALHIAQTLLRFLGFGAKDPTHQDLLQKVVNGIQNLSQQVAPLDQNGKDLNQGVAKIPRSIQEGTVQGLETLFKPLQKTIQSMKKNQKQSAADLNEHLQTIQDTLEQIRTDLYENRRRFTKLGAQSEVLAESAADWDAIQDQTNGLVWEHKAAEGERDQSRRLFWREAPAYVDRINAQKLAGFSDWRLPSVEELQTLLVPPSGPDRRFFGPLTDPSNPYPGVFSVQPADAPDKGQSVTRESGEPFLAKKAHVLLVRGGESVREKATDAR